MYSRTTLILAACTSLATLGACTQTYKETEGLTLGAGNAVAHNTALQMVDPWPEGVQDTTFAVPAERKSNAPADDAAPEDD
ncbi:MAG: hypothetical protein AAFO77_00910 [Pseudomonadota bacterium]